MLKNLVHDLFLISDDKFTELEGVLLKRGGGIYSPHLQPTIYVNLHFNL